MKKRMSFVANSSSSSFLIIESDPANTTELYKVYTGQLFVVGLIGETEFGWSRHEYKDAYSKINFAYIQTTVAFPEQLQPVWREMLDKVIKAHTGAVDIEYKITDEYDHPEFVHGYIDHQSSACEEENTEIFDTEDKLRDFLFNTESYIETGNDNDGDQYY